MTHTFLRSLFQRESPYAKTASYYLCFVILGLAMAAIGPALPGLAEQTGSSLGSISFLFTARSLGYMIGSVIAGRLYDRYPGHPLIIAGLLLIMVAFVLIPITSILMVLFVLVITIGITEASIDVGSNAMLVWIHGAAVPPFMNGLHFFFGLGAFLAPVLFAQFVSAGLQSTTLFWAMAGLVLPIIVIISTIPSPKIVAQTVETQSGSSSNGLIILIAAAFFLYVG
ncbi:MAG TPA: MFS transporter, partial [Anaerolineaceae bacterium]|nr:MFS transporter [Anaerolineaceae bacterium]